MRNLNAATSSVTLASKGPSKVRATLIAGRGHRLTRILFASLRRYLMLVASMCFPIEYLLAYANPYYRFLHDRIAKTSIVRID